MRVLTSRSRGQALFESAIALPVFLLVMFGVIWALRTGVLSERVELVARYGGMISAEIHPYQQYSLYAVYSAASGTPLAMPCVTPPPTLIGNAGPLSAPAQATAQFWQSATTPTTAVTCGKVLASTAGLSAPMLLSRAAITVQAGSAVPLGLSGTGGTTQLNAALARYQSPDMATLVGCYDELKTAFLASVSPQSDAAPDVVPQVETQFPTAPLSLNAACSSN